MFAELAASIGLSAIYDFGKSLIGAAAKTEFVQSVVAKLGLSPKEHDFVERYVEALVDLRLQEKSPVIMAFFREESIMAAFYDFYYANPESGKRGDEAAHQAALNHCIEALKVGDEVKAAQVDVAAEVAHFWTVFRQKVQESRTVKEAEMEQKLSKLQVTADNVQHKVTELLATMQQQGMTDIEIGGQVQPIESPQVQKMLTQRAGKIFNIEKIQTAHFHIYPDSKLPHELTKIPTIDLNTGFLGRHKDLERLEKQLQSSAQAVLVNGLGGIGKTTLARAYVHRHYNDYQHIAWIGGAEDLLTAFALNQDLAANLDMPFQEKEDIQERLQAILQRLRGLSAPGNGRNLLVIDNAVATIADKAVHDQLPGPPGWHVLVTSREELPGFQPLKLDTLEPEAARELFRTHYKGRVGEQELETLLTTIGYHTLTIELLAKMLQRMSGLLTVTQLTEKLSRHELDDPDIQEAVWTQHSGEQRTVYKHLIQAFELSHLSPEEKHLLANLAVLPAVTYTAPLLAELLNIEALPLNRMLQSLADKGWINRHEEGGFSVHRMLQEVVILQERPGYEDLKILLGVLTEKMKEDDYGNPVTENFPWVPYAEPLAAYFSRSGSAEEVVAIFCHNLGRIHTDTGDLGKAMQAYKQMERNYAALLVNSPGNAYFKNGLAISYSKLGETHSELGNLDKALQFFEQYNQLEKELYEAYPNNVSFKNGLAISYQFLGHTHTALGNLEEALQFFEQRSQLGKELYEAYPNNVSFKNGLATAICWLGITHTALGHLEKALGYYEQYNQLEKELYEAYPNNVSFKNGLAISYSKLGHTHTALGHLEEALQFFEQSKNLIKELYEAYPNNVEFKNNLAISYNYLGNTYSALGHLDQALGYYEQYNQLEKELYEAYPNNVSFKNGLAISYEKLGSTHTELGHLDKALQFFEQRSQLGKELYEAYPNNVSFKNGLAISYSKLGETHSELGNLDKALQFFEQYNQLEKELYEAYPNNVEFKNNLAISYCKLAEVYRDHHQDRVRARMLFLEAQKHWEALALIAPQYVQFRRFLEAVRHDLERLG
jgi:tetratricopeptide (TPR) repeat protein